MSVKYNVQKDATRLNGREVNGVIKATLDNTKYDVVNMVCKMAPLVPVHPERYMLRDAYFAKTGCSVCDEYNEELGKSIAKKKMMMKYDLDKMGALLNALDDIEAVHAYLMHQLQMSVERYERNAADLSVHK